MGERSHAYTIFWPNHGEFLDCCFCCCFCCCLCCCRRCCCSKPGCHGCAYPRGGGLMDATIAVPLILLLLRTCRSHGSTPLQSKSELRLSALTADGYRPCMATDMSTIIVTMLVCTIQSICH